MKSIHAELIVIGAGPGGYAAAFYAASLGKKVLLIEQTELGGVCLNRGCIPSKALLHATKMISEASASKDRGITFSNPKIDIDKLRDWKNDIVSKLSNGIGQLAKQKNVDVMKGRALFESSNSVRVETKAGQQIVTFDHAILAVGSKPSLPPSAPLDPLVISFPNLSRYGQEYLPPEPSRTGSPA